MHRKNKEENSRKLLVSASTLEKGGKKNTLLKEEEQSSSSTHACLCSLKKAVFLSFFFFNERAPAALRSERSLVSWSFRATSIPAIWQIQQLQILAFLKTWKSVVSSFSTSFQNNIAWEKKNDSWRAKYEMRLAHYSSSPLPSPLKQTQ